MKFKVGDRVRIVKRQLDGENETRKCKWTPGMDEYIGDEIILKKNHFEELARFKDRIYYNSWAFVEEWLELVTKKTMRKFKKGDKVSIKSKTVPTYERNIFPSEGIIGDVYGDGSGKNGSNCLVIEGNYYAPRDLDLITSQREFKVGDKVKYVSDNHGDAKSNPLWGGKEGKVAGTIKAIGKTRLPITVVWENGNDNSYEKGDLELIDNDKTEALPEMIKELINHKFINKDYRLTIEGKKALEYIKQKS